MKIQGGGPRPAAVDAHGNDQVFSPSGAKQIMMSIEGDELMVC